MAANKRAADGRGKSQSRTAESTSESALRGEAAPLPPRDMDAMQESISPARRMAGPQTVEPESTDTSYDSPEPASDPD